MASPEIADEAMTGDSKTMNHRTPIVTPTNSAAREGRSWV